MPLTWYQFNWYMLIKEAQPDAAQNDDYAIVLFQ